MRYAIQLCLAIILKVLTSNETEVALLHFFALCGHQTYRYLLIGSVPLTAAANAVHLL